MANSRKSNSSSSAAFESTIAAALEPQLFARARLVLGLSGGVDSVVLLHVLHRLARELGYELSCVHVNHAISPHARAWAQFCARLCRRYRVQLITHEVDLAPYRDEGLEAAARRARYDVYASLAHADFIVLAQHLDDQAETVLLQLLRGAGVKGGAAMPLRRQLARTRNSGDERRPAILRPMLGATRAQISAYARAHKLRWIDDESNNDTRRDRNFLRHRVLPVVEQRFVAYRSTLARAAANLAEASALLEQLAQSDARACRRGNSVALGALRRLGAARAKNLLRWMLAQLGVRAPEADQLQEALRQLLEAGDDAAVRIVFGGLELRRYAGRAYLLAGLPPLPGNFRLRWDGSRKLDLRELGGRLQFTRRRGQGLACARVHEGALELRLRSGGETLRLRAGARTRSLKKLLQEAQLPPWERERLPLVYCAGSLVAVPGIGVAAGWEAKAGELGWVISWAGTAGS